MFTVMWHTSNEVCSKILHQFGTQKAYDHDESILRSDLSWDSKQGLKWKRFKMYSSFDLFQDSVRGLLNTLSQFFTCFGSLTVYAVGPFTSYKVLHYVILSICAVFLLLFPLIPDSPHYLVLKNEISSARTTLTWLRQNTPQASIEKELRDIQVRTLKSKFTFSHIIYNSVEKV